MFDIIIFKMKRTILLLILFIPFFINAQDPYNYKFGGRVFENGRKLTPSDINIYFSDNPEILKLYTKGIRRTIKKIKLKIKTKTFIIKEK